MEMCQYLNHGDHAVRVNTSQMSILSVPITSFVPVFPPSLSLFLETCLLHNVLRMELHQTDVDVVATEQIVVRQPRRREDSWSILPCVFILNNDFTA